jgi:hypothetical protein
VENPIYIGVLGTKVITAKSRTKMKPLKKKHNEISGNLSSFVVFNSVNPSILENLASTTNIKARNSSKEIATIIDTMQAKEITKSTLMVAKQRVIELVMQKEIESEASKSNTEVGRYGGNIQGNTTDQGHNKTLNTRATVRKENAENKKQFDTESEDIESDREGRTTDIEVMEEIEFRGRHRNQPPKNCL